MKVNIGISTVMSSVLVSSLFATAPTITKFSATKPTDLTNKEVLEYGLNEKIKIYGLLKDDNKSSSVKITLNFGDKNETNITALSNSIDGNISFDINYSYKNAGTYDVNMTAKDVDNQTIFKSIKLKIIDKLPDINLTAVLPTNTVYYPNEVINLTAKVTEDYNLSSVYFDNNGTSSTSLSIVGYKTGITKDYNLTAKYSTAGTYKLVFGAKDVNSSGSVRDKNMTLDIKVVPGSRCSQGVLSQIQKAGTWHLLSASTTGCSISSIKEIATADKNATLVYQYNASKKEYNTSDIIAQGQGFWIKTTAYIGTYKPIVYVDINATIPNDGNATNSLKVPGFPVLATCKVTGTALVNAAVTGWNLMGAKASDCNSSSILKASGATTAGSKLWLFEPISGKYYNRTSNINMYEGFWINKQ